MTTFDVCPNGCGFVYRSTFTSCPACAARKEIHMMIECLDCGYKWDSARFQQCPQCVPLSLQGCTDNCANDPVGRLLQVCDMIVNNCHTPADYVVTLEEGIPSSLLKNLELAIESVKALRGMR